MGYFKTPRPARKAARPAERRPRDWRRQTHVCVSAGIRDGDGTPICSECFFRQDHPIHNLNETVQVEATELERRKLGEGSDG